MTSLPHHVGRLLPCGGDSRGLSEGRGKQGRQRDARATQPPNSTGGSVGEGLSVGRLSGWVMTNCDGPANRDSIGCGVEVFLTSDH